MKVEILPITSITPYARNPRLNTGIPVAKVKASLKEFGWQQPIVVDKDRVIVVGHTRYAAALELGMNEVPVHVADCLTPTQIKAYRIADNKTATFSGWDMDLLDLEFDDLKAEEFDLDLTGFDADELAGIELDSEPETEGDTEPQTDRAEELRVQWGVEEGQLWAMDDHRLLCGDSTKAEDVGRLMNGERANLCFTSPPYGQQRDYRDGATEKVSDWDTLMQGVFGNLPMADSGQVFVNLGIIHKDGEFQSYWEDWIQWMRQQGWRRFSMYIWDQGPGMPGDFGGHLAPAYELIFHFNKKSVAPLKTKEKLKESIGINNHSGGTRNKDGSLSKRSNPEASLQTHKIPDSVIRVMRHKARGIECEHPAVFPVELPAEFMAAWPGIIYEPFSGSGTTIIAAENLKRKARAIEISPAYVAVALQRWADHTGKTPTLIPNGP